MSHRKIHVATIVMPNGANFYTALTRKDLNRQIAKFCESWAEQENIAFSENCLDETKISIYFEVAQHETLFIGLSDADHLNLEG